MDLKKFYTDNKFGMLTDLHSMVDTTIHGSGVHLVNTNNGVFLENERKTSGSGNVKWHIFTISDAQMNVMDKHVDKYMDPNNIHFNTLIMGSPNSGRTHDMPNLCPQ